MKKMLLKKISFQEKAFQQEKYPEQNIRVSVFTTEIVFTRNIIIIKEDIFAS